MLLALPLLLSDWIIVSLMTSRAVLGCAIEEEEEEDAAEVTTATLEMGVTESSDRPGNVMHTGGGVGRTSTAGVVGTGGNWVGCSGLCSCGNWVGCSGRSSSFTATTGDPASSAGAAVSWARNSALTVRCATELLMSALLLRLEMSSSQSALAFLILATVSAHAQSGLDWIRFTPSLSTTQIFSSLEMRCRRNLLDMLRLCACCSTVSAFILRFNRQRLLASLFRSRIRCFKELTLYENITQCQQQLDHTLYVLSLV